jgi:unsaturated rhamnogalacturonyl hydrolase
MNKSTSNPLVFFIIIFTFISCSQDAPQLKWDDTKAMIKALQWQEQHPIFALAPTDWTNGAYYIGVTKAYQATQDPIFLAAHQNNGVQKRMETLRTHIPCR